VVADEAVQLPTFFEPLIETYSSKLPTSPFQSAVYENVAVFPPSVFELVSVIPPPEEVVFILEVPSPVGYATDVCLNVAEDEPLALKSHANAGAASATEATAANIILLNCFITLLKML
jgi:hypothetical protein